MIMDSFSRMQEIYDIGELYNQVLVNTHYIEDSDEKQKILITIGVELCNLKGYLKARYVFEFALHEIHEIKDRSS